MRVFSVALLFLLALPGAAQTLKPKQMGKIKAEAGAALKNKMVRCGWVPAGVKLTGFEVTPDVGYKLSFKGQFDDIDSNPPIEFTLMARKHLGRVASDITEWHSKLPVKNSSVGDFTLGWMREGDDRRFSSDWRPLASGTVYRFEGRAGGGMNPFVMDAVLKLAGSLTAQKL